MKKLRAIPKHLDIDKKKTLDVQFDTQKFPHETFNTKTKTKQNQKGNVKICAFVIKNLFGILKQRMWSIWIYGTFATIAKNIMNYI